VGADFIAATPAHAKLPDRVGKKRSSDKPLGEHF
jgi:hypothetical protein